MNIITPASERVDTINFILRGQPFHNAHEKTCIEAAMKAGTLNLIFGCANKPRDEDDPFYQSERIEVARQVTANFKQKYGCDVNFMSVENSIYNNTQWATWVAEAADPYCHGNTKLIGHNKDESSFYLNMFPQWGDPILLPQFDVLDATTIRNLYFSKKNNLDFFRHVCPDATMNFLDEFMHTDHYEYVVAEAAYIKSYREQTRAGSKYPPVFMTGDAIVIKNGHVLMIERRSQPGKGLWAFPGGFLRAEDEMVKGELKKADIDLVACALRELEEETKIKSVSPAQLRGSIVAERRFDHPKRSRRGRVVTTTQLILLDDDKNPSLNKVKGSDDARVAVWRPIHQVKRIECFEDHYDQLLWARGALAANSK